MKAKIDLEFETPIGGAVNAKDMGRDLVVLNNMRLTMKRSSVVRRALLLAEKYGIPHGDGEKLLVKHLFRLGDSMAKLAKRKGHPEGKPIDAFGREILPVGLHKSDCFMFFPETNQVVLFVDDLVRCAHLSFYFSKDKAGGECDNCGGAMMVRAGSRFCSDYCRDVSKKKRMRDAAKKEGYHAVEQ